MIVWIVCWVITLLVLLIPLCYTRERRQNVWNALCCRENAVSSRAEPAADPGRTESGTDEVYHYRLSKAQEDEIRESFLVDKLKPYTQAITEADIIRHDGRESDGSTQGSSCTNTTGYEDQLDAYDHNGTTDSDEDCSKVATEVAVRELEKGVDIESGTDVSSRERALSNENLSTSDISDEILEEIAQFEDENELIKIPIAGECRHDLLPESGGRPQRQVPNGCAICLSAFDVEDKVTWSSNRDCCHVFHHGCVVDWLQASGRKAMRRRRRNEEAPVLNYSYDPITRITQFPTLCPCCRQEFILLATDEESSLGTDAICVDAATRLAATLDLDSSAALSLPNTQPLDGDSASHGLPAADS